ncbi:MAG: transcription antitermination factor NusB [Clostridia bacterium]|jgi:N utilization substance protein B
MGRKVAREIAMQLLYEWIMGGEGGQYILDEISRDKGATAEDYKYIQDIRHGVEKHMIEIDDIIRKYAIGWKLERLAKIDLSILRLAIYEILYRDDIPAYVSMNEAVELAKKYSSEGAPSFINGILANFYRNSLEEQGSIKP